MDQNAVKRRLTIMRVITIVDFILFVPLVAVELEESLKFPIGLSHGILVIVLVLFAVKGALDRMWGWWFAPLTVVPLGSLLGEVIVRRRLTD